MDKRRYGQTDDWLSILGFGGIIVSKLEQKLANEYVAEAFDAGVNYFDVAPSYGDAELQLGPALVPYRSKVFLACKTQERMGEGARSELERSLKRLQTDHFDLYQLHGMTTADDVEQAVGPNGALETLMRAKEAGKVRYVGFSAHSAETALQLMECFPFDSILFPINFVNWFAGGFGPQVAAEAARKGVAVLAIKAIAKTRPKSKEERKYPGCWYIPFDEPDLASLALRFTLAQGAVAAVSSGDMQLFRLALQCLTQDSSPPDAKELQQLEDLAADIVPIFTSHET